MVDGTHRLGKSPFPGGHYLGGGVPDTHPREDGAISGHTANGAVGADCIATSPPILCIR